MFFSGQILRTLVMRQVSGTVVQSCLLSATYIPDQVLPRGSCSLTRSAHSLFKSRACLQYIPKLSKHAPPPSISRSPVLYTVRGTVPCPVRSSADDRGSGRVTKRFWHQTGTGRRIRERKWSKERKTTRSRNNSLTPVRGTLARLPASEARRKEGARISP